MREEDLRGEALAYYGQMLRVFTGMGLSHEHKRAAAMRKVQEWMDSKARKAAAEKKQLKLFGD